MPFAKFIARRLGNPSGIVGKPGLGILVEHNSTLNVTENSRATG